MRNRFWLFVACCVVVGVQGCANYTAAVKVTDVPTKQDAFLYGNFNIKAPKTFLGMDGHQTMGFVLSCVDGARYNIRFSIDDSIKALRVAPSTCSLAELVFSNADGAVRSRKPAPAGVMKDINIAAGKGYYLGDFYAESSTTVQGNMIHTNWAVKDIKYNYEQTTEVLKKALPNLAQMETVDQMLLSALSR